MKNRGMLRVVRDGEVKLSLPDTLVTIKEDGTVWYNNMPILGINDPIVKARLSPEIKSGKYDNVPQNAWTRLGHNPNGLWVGEDDVLKKQNKKNKKECCRRCGTYCYGDCKD